MLSRGEKSPERFLYFTCGPWCFQLRRAAEEPSTEVLCLGVGRDGVCRKSSRGFVENNRKGH